MKRSIGVVLLVALTACGKSSPTAPSIASVGGLWTATVQLTGVSGGDCVGQTIPIGGRQTYTLQITQTGSALTAVATNTSTGAATTFSGTAGENAISLNGTSSTNAWTVGYACWNGARRDVSIQATTVNANVDGNRGSGTYAETSNVFITGTQLPVGVMTANASFTMAR